jgi:hypothetical protein
MSILGGGWSRLALVASISILAACSSSSDNAGAGGAGGSGAGGSTGTTGGGTPRTDGTLGSSCGTCVGGLTCVTDASIPEGYCTTQCQDASACGGLGFCYQTSQGGYCLRSCAATADCRAGYSCQGDPGATVCYPGGTTGGGAGGGNGAGGGTSGGGGCIDLATLTQTWWQPSSGSTLEQIKFNENGSIDYEYYNSVGGTTPYGGTWQLNCPMLVAMIQGSDTYNYTVTAQGLVLGSKTWVRCTQPVSSGKCFLEEGGVFRRCRRDLAVCVLAVAPLRLCAANDDLPPASTKVTHLPG